MEIDIQSYISSAANITTDRESSSNKSNSKFEDLKLRMVKCDPLDFLVRNREFEMIETNLEYLLETSDKAPKTWFHGKI